MSATGRMVVTVFLAALAAGCASEFPQSAVNPKGPVAHMQHDLFILSLWVVFGVFVVVGGALFVAVFRFREREGDDRPAAEDLHGNAALEWGFMAVSAVILIFLAIPNVKALYMMYDPPEGSDPLVVNVTGRQWWWQFEYPEYEFQTGNEFVIPVSRPIQIHLRTADVIHSFWAPQFAGKLDTMPNQDNRMWLQADELGVFPGLCAELCGDSHALMKFVTVVKTEADFDTWVANQKKNAAPFTHGLNREAVTQGQQLFSTKGCLACHTVRGTAAMGVLGPDLTHFGSRKTVAAGIMERNPENIKKWITNPPAVKPGSLMPKTEMTDSEADALVAYLMALK